MALMRLRRTPRVQSSVWEVLYAFGDDLGHLHHSLAKRGVFFNVALNAIAVGLQFFTEVLQLNDEILNFHGRGAQHST